MNSILDIIKVLASFLVGAVTLSFLSYTQKTVVGYPHLILGYAVPALVGGLVGATLFILYRRTALLTSNTPAALHSFSRIELTYSILAGGVTLCLFSAIQKALAGYPMKLAGFTVPVLFGGLSGALIGMYLTRNRRLLIAQQEAGVFLQQEKERTDDIITSISDGLLVTDTDGRIELVNPAAEALLDIPAKDLIGQTLAAVLQQASVEDHSSLLHPDNIGHSTQIRLNTQDGSLRTVHARTAAVHNTQRCNGEIVLLLHDNTEEQRIDRMKSEFLSTATHNLKTPITAITGYSELLMNQDQLSSDEQQEFLSYIYDKAWQLNKLIDNLLDISRVESGREIRLEKSDIKAQALLEDIQSFCDSQQTRCEFHYQFEQTDSLLYIDLAKIVLVMENLISNAMKFSPGGGLISLAGQQIGTSYEIKIADEGIGMSDEECCQVFDRFYRADMSDAAPQGFGLGLTLVKQLVEAHGGKIQVNSIPRQGTTVSFQLPIRNGAF
nr:ATP-binding protein [uncultured Desulfuromonas sp.]